MASAALDRLLHRATVINIKGEPYRMKEKRLTGLFPGASLWLTHPKEVPAPKLNHPAILLVRGVGQF